MNTEKMIVLVGLPRSGTTMATAMFDVHPEIAAWFEPWNVRQDSDPKPYNSISDFILQYKEVFQINIENKKALMFKETTAHAPALKWTEDSVENIKIENPNVEVKVIWLVRDINHAYLSRVHTARKHWGHPDMKIDTETFRSFVDFAYFGFQQIENLTKKNDSCILSYEKLVSDPKETMEKVMNFVGMEPHPNQFEYYKHFKTHKSAGDPEVSSSPKPIDPSKIEKRDEEWREHQDIFIESLNEQERKKYEEMMQVVSEIREKGFMKI